MRWLARVLVVLVVAVAASALAQERTRPWTSHAWIALPVITVRGEAVSIPSWRSTEGTFSAGTWRCTWAIEHTDVEPCENGSGDLLAGVSDIRVLCRTPSGHAVGTGVMCPDGVATETREAPNGSWVCDLASRSDPERLMLFEADNRTAYPVAVGCGLFERAALVRSESRP
jgi:hypothetical protein